jgi:uncharacterized protein
MYSKSQEELSGLAVSKIIFLLLIIFIFSVSPYQDSAAQQGGPIKFVTKVEGSASYMATLAMAEVFKRKLNKSVAVQILPTVPEDFIALKLGDGDLFATTTAEFFDAFNGHKGTMGTAGRVDVRALAQGSVGGAGIIVTRRSNINNGGQLKGQKLYINYTKAPLLGRKGMATLQAYGLDPDKDVTMLSYSSTDEVTDGIREGKAVGVWYLVGGDKCQQLDSMIPGGCKLLPLPQDVALLEKYMWPVDPSVALGMVPKQATVPEPTPGWVTTYTLGSRPGISDDQAYGVTKALWENLTDVAAGYRVLGDWLRKDALDPFLIPFHPGAIKYYKEVGIWSANQDKKQQELLGKYK